MQGLLISPAEREFYVRRAERGESPGVDQDGAMTDCVEIKEPSEFDDVLALRAILERRGVEWVKTELMTYDAMQPSSRIAGK
ncbi:MAG TPA: hypothetical protein VFB99_15010 [Vicinamibacterales bacterium]|nr:hypothetical protein [Vicinamibacterales bacterium]